MQDSVLKDRWMASHKLRCGLYSGLTMPTDLGLHPEQQRPQDRQQQEKEPPFEFRLLGVLPAKSHLDASFASRASSGFPPSSSVAQVPPYEAVSYTWGDPSN